MFKTVADIAKENYCSGCGVCAGICPFNALSIEFNKYGEYIPVLNDALCTDCGVCLKVCPFSNNSKTENVLGDSLFSKIGNIKHDQFLGYYLNTYVGHSADENIRLNAASGGITSQILLKLFEDNLVDYVACVFPNQINDSRLFSYRLINNPNEILKGAKSVYYPVESSQVIKEILKLKESKIAFVGLPCTIKAFRNAIDYQPRKFSTKDLFFIGLTCGGMKSRAFSEFLFMKNSGDKKNIKSINYRTKKPNRKADNFGYEFKCENHNGEINTVEIQFKEDIDKYWNGGYFQLNSCFFCDDVFSELADISVMDAWLPEYVDDWKGNNLIITRTSLGEKIIKDLVINKQLNCELINYHKIINSQYGVTRKKRQGLRTRVKYSQKHKKWVPEKRIYDETIISQADEEKNINLLKVSKITQNLWVISQNARILENTVRVFYRLQNIKIILRKLRNKLAYIYKKILKKLNDITYPILSLVIISFFRILRYLKNFFSSSDKLEKKIIFLPPASPGSLGDEAVITAFIQLIMKKELSSLGIMIYNLNDNWKNIPFEYEINKSILFPNLSSLKDLTRFLRPIYQYDYFYVLGTDVLDGGYSIKDSLDRIRVGKILNQIGLSLSYISFSINKHLSEEIINELSDLPDNVRLICRDPVSQRRLRKLIDRDVDLSSDIAFVLQPDDKSQIVKSVKAWADVQKNMGRFILGINLNPQVFKNPKDFKRVDDLLFSYKYVIEKLFKKEKLSILLLPHDFRRDPSDYSLTLKLIEQLSSLSEEDIYLPNSKYNSREVKAIVKYTDSFLTGRMHIAIHCLSQAIPIACITYQDKFEGLMEHFGFDGMTITPDDALNPEKLFSFLVSVIDRRNEIKKEIKQRLPQVIELAEKNIS